MTQRLDEERVSNNRNLFKLQARENEIRAMKAKISSAIAEKDVLTARLAKANEDYLRMKAQIESSTKTKEEMDRKAKETAEREGVSLGKIVVDPKKSR
jgi:peptidoglycan hydrolase CwlO-like protein